MAKYTSAIIAEMQKDAANGSATAQYMLANAYYNGNGVRRDPEEGGRWLLKAAEQGHGPAQCDLGVMYSKGLGVEQNYKESVRWLSAAAESGDTLAQHSLGSISAKGMRLKGTSFFNRRAFAYMKATQDYVEAYKWFTLAAAGGQKASLRDRNIIKRWMKPDQIERAEKLIEEFRRAKGLAEPMIRNDMGSANQSPERTFSQGTAGSITFQEGKRPLIRLSDKTNASTIYYLLAIQMLETLMKDSTHEQAPAEFKADAQTVRDWLDLRKGDEISDTANEQFARGFETFLMEDHVDLGPHFSDVARLLKSVYEKGDSLHPAITGDIRGVYRRMFMVK